MRKILLLAVVALAAVPASYANNSPTPSQQASAMCKQQRTAMGAASFALLYGGAKNAYGRCVSKLASTVESDHANAAKQCAAERADASFAATHGKTFDQFYGATNKKGKGSNAFGKCVSSKAQAQAQQQQQSTINAAKTCKAEFTSLGAAAFKAKYGGHSNAFGKCVSKTAKANNP